MCSAICFLLLLLLFYSCSFFFNHVDGDDDEIEWVNFEQDINDARLRCGIIRFTSNKLEHWYCRYHLQKFRQTYNSVYLLLSGSALIYMLWDVLEHYVNLDDDYEQFNLHSSEWVCLPIIIRNLLLGFHKDIFRGGF